MLLETIFLVKIFICVVKAYTDEVNFADAVASIIGTIAKKEIKPKPKLEVNDEKETMDVKIETEKTKVADNMEFSSSETISIAESLDIKAEVDSVS